METTRMRPFSLLVKPASADCNLRCTYCFYLEKCALYPESRVHKMSDEVSERLISSYMKTPQPVYAFGWQGGEPTLMGLDFFRRVVRLQQSYGRPGCSVSNGLQTNGTLLSDEMAAFFSEYNFLLGISLDGPEQVHDVYRRNSSGEGSHRSVLRGIRTLRRNRTEFNILTLVSSANVRRGREVYKYLKDEGFFFHQYIPCVEWDPAGSPLPWAIDGKDWGRFLLDIFACWYPGDVKSLSVRHFDSIINFLVYGRHNVCFMGGNCTQYFLVEHTGDVYPCDFFAREDLRLGNVGTHTWKALLESSIYRRFGAAKSRWAEECGDCEFLPFCSGDCLKHRPGFDRSPEVKSHLCEGWKLFYRETLPVFRTLAADWLRENRGDPSNLHPRALSGDESCYCGSGKLYRNCHGVGTAIKRERA
jgi:uncharacterized protein